MQASPTAIAAAIAVVFFELSGSQQLLIVARCSELEMTIDYNAQPWRNINCHQDVTRAEWGTLDMRNAKRGFTLVEILIVVIIVGILSLAAIPLMTNNTRDARRAEAEQLMGAARDFCRCEYAKTGDSSSVQAGFTFQVGQGNFNGEYFDVTTFNDSSGVLDASVQTDTTADGQGTLDFEWESGQSQFSWDP
jgi:prepilin-type N-terminal cleavage/methylation domain-containing protein